MHLSAGKIYSRLRTLGWTAFYYILRPLFFSRLGRRCRFEGWIELPQGRTVFLGDNVHISRNVEFLVLPSAEIVIGSNSFIGRGVMISAHKSVRIGADCLLAEYVCIHDNNHKRTDPALPIHKQGFEAGTVEIGDGSWVGSHALLLMNSKLGARAVLAAGAVLTKSIPDGQVAVGIPAKVKSSDSPA